MTKLLFLAGFLFGYIGIGEGSPIPSQTKGSWGGVLMASNNPHGQLIDRDGGNPGDPRVWCQHSTKRRPRLRRRQTKKR